VRAEFLLRLEEQAAIRNAASAYGLRRIAPITTRRAREQSRGLRSTRTGGWAASFKAGETAARGDSASAGYTHVIEQNARRGGTI
jgi:hypothetical protein